MNRFGGRFLTVAGILTVLLFSAACALWADEDLVQSNKELKALVSALEKKVDQLESRVAAAERGGAPVAISGGEAGEGMVRTKGGDIQLSGFVDTSFNWNFITPGVTPPATNNATGNTTIRAFDRESDTFDVNNVQMNIKRPAPDAGGAGFNTEFTYGTDAQVIESGGFLGGTDEFSIQEAYVEIKAPLGSGLTIWAGKFATLLGAEVIENYQNWNASRSLLFNLAIPFTHTGVRGFYNWLDGKISTAVGLVNGWDLAIDNNKFKDIEAQIKWNGTENFSLVSNFMLGTQVVDDLSDHRGIIDLVATWVPLPEDLPKLTLMANYDYGWEERLGDVAGREGHAADWQGYALYAKYDLYDWLAFGARFEQFWDDQVVRVPTAGLTNLWEMTYTADVKVYENLLTRLEYRHDHADSSMTFDTATQNNQDTIGASLVYLFG